MYSFHNENLNIVKYTAPGIPLKKKKKNLRSLYFLSKNILPILSKNILTNRSVLLALEMTEASFIYKLIYKYDLFYAER